MPSSLEGGHRMKRKAESETKGKRGTGNGIHVSGYSHGSVSVPMIHVNDDIEAALVEATIELLGEFSREAIEAAGSIRIMLYKEGAE